MTSSRAALLFLFSVLPAFLSVCGAQDTSEIYQFPEALARPSGSTLRRGPGEHLSFTADPDLGEVRIFSRRKLGDGEWSIVDHVEPVSMAVTAACSDFKDTLYLTGTDALGRTCIHRWVARFVTDLQGTASIALDKAILVNATPDLTHISSMAVPPSEECLFLRRFETGEILRMDLNTGARTSLLDDQQVPALSLYTEIVWREHVARGEALILETFYDPRVRAGQPADPKAIVLWYDDFAAAPAKVEFRTVQDWTDLGYDDIDQWAPNRFHFGSQWGQPFPVEDGRP